MNKKQFQEELDKVFENNEIHFSHSSKQMTKNEAKKGKSYDLPKSNLYFYGFGRDKNGAIAKLSFPDEKIFNIQLGYIWDSYKLRGNDEFTDNDLEVIGSEMVDYITNSGSKVQKAKLKVH